MGNGLKYIILGIVAFISQILISEYVNIWPMLYIAAFPLLLIVVPPNMNTAVYMITAFGVGLGIDALSDGILGLNAAACVAMAYLRKPLLNLILSKSSFDSIESVSSKEIGSKKFTFFCFFMYAIFILVYTVLDNFWSAPIIFTLLRILLNIAINVIFAVVIEATLISKFMIKYRG